MRYVVLFIWLIKKFLNSWSPLCKSHTFHDINEMPLLIFSLVGINQKLINSAIDDAIFIIFSVLAESIFLYFVKLERDIIQGLSAIKKKRNRRKREERWINQVSIWQIGYGLNAILKRGMSKRKIDMEGDDDDDDGDDVRLWAISAR